jgi:hypothetical protein
MADYETSPSPGLSPESIRRRAATIRRHRRAWSIGGPTAALIAVVATTLSFTALPTRNAGTPVSPPATHTPTSRSDVTSQPRPFQAVYRGAGSRNLYVVAQPLQPWCTVSYTVDATISNDGIAHITMIRHVEHHPSYHCGAVGIRGPFYALVKLSRPYHRATVIDQVSGLTRAIRGTIQPYPAQILSPR